MEKYDLLYLEQKDYDKKAQKERESLIASFFVLVIIFCVCLICISHQTNKINALEGKISQDSIAIQAYKDLLTVPLD